MKLKFCVSMKPFHVSPMLFWIWNLRWKIQPFKSFWDWNWNCHIFTKQPPTLSKISPCQSPIGKTVSASLYMHRPSQGMGEEREHTSICAKSSHAPIRDNCPLPYHWNIPMSVPWREKSMHMCAWPSWGVQCRGEANIPQPTQSTVRCTLQHM